MPTGHTNRFLRLLAGAVLARDGAGLTDAQLLGLFVERREEAAFEALLRRHGPMVWGVCRRVLGNADDAEDAFQAAFLVLVRKAAAVSPRAALGGWLYGVAYRTALEARKRRDRRRTKEKQVEQIPQPAVEADDPWREMLPLLDHELSRLPDKYRVPVVLCDLEGATRKEAARQLRIPEGTLSSRLAQARKLLAKRLSRHGPVLSVGALGALLCRNAAPACVPHALLSSTAKVGMVVASGQALSASGRRSSPCRASRHATSENGTASTMRRKRAKAPGDRSRAEGDKSIARSKLWPRVASAVEWLAGEANHPVSDGEAIGEEAASIAAPQVPADASGHGTNVASLRNPTSPIFRNLASVATGVRKDRGTIR
jgi:RNA polymerase sigma factor (sigma-70 family)